MKCKQHHIPPVEFHLTFRDEILHEARMIDTDDQLIDWWFEDTTQFLNTPPDQRDIPYVDTTQANLRPAA